ncbi:MAG: hypothetical protein Q9162_004567 [Coniocarpon cinnabarinum]
MSPATSVALDRGRRYASYWSTEENSIKTLPPEKYEALRTDRRKNYKDIAVEFVIPTFRWNERFHFCPFPDPRESIDAALKRHEHYLALVLGLKPGMRGLDAGCGLGPVSRELARFAGVHITGISINSDHVERATRTAKEEGLKGVEYIEGDFMDLSRFPDNTFDFAYACEATVYAPSLTAVYTELTRVLKPGAPLAIYEWLLLPPPYGSFNPTNPYHLDIRQRLERGDGITNIVTVPEALAAFSAAGLEIYKTEDRGRVNPNGTDIEGKKWWYHIDGDLSGAATWRDWWTVLWLKPWFWRAQCGLAWVLEGLRVIERGPYEALRTQSQAVYGMRDGAVEGVFTNVSLW